MLDREGGKTVSGQQVWSCLRNAETDICLDLLGVGEAPKVAPAGGYKIHYRHAAGRSVL